MNITVTTSKTLNCKYIIPVHKNSYENQLYNCITQLLTHTEQSGEQVHSLTVFVSSTGNNEFRARHQYTNKVLSRLKPTPPFIIVAQPPMQPYLVAFEAITLHQEAECNFTYKKFNDLSYLVIEDRDYKELVSGGIYYHDPMAGIDSQSEGCFELTEQLLRHEGMTFADVVRQWNYIEGIVDYQNQSQRYQVFNDVRSVYYNKCRFTNGFPAATGIGTSGGGVTLAVIARQCRDEKSIKPIHNPNQMDAHQYSERVLGENSLFLQQQKSTPKFERGKLIENGDEAILYVSGTASIKGEDTTGEGDFVAQTHTTLDNIEQLIAVSNLQKQYPSASYSRSSILNLRVYVKEAVYFEEAYRICSMRHPGVPVQVVLAHVCRPDLLVEIECLARIF